LEAEQIAALRVRGALIEKSKEHFVIRLGLVGGSCDPELLRGAAELAERFGNGSVHLTTRQSIEIQNVPEELIHDALVHMDTLGLPSANSGERVRTIVACPGHPVCRFSTGDTQSLAQSIHSHFRNYEGLHTKVKISITGCPNSCAKPQENDIGIMTMGPRGYRLFIAGRIGRKPSLAIPLDSYAANEDAVIRFIARTLDWLAERGGPKERFASVIERVGQELFHSDVTKPWTQECAATLEQA
jgi:dissimilatory sulfite reductase (desulfoviridin) alpha/beta subunit